MYVQDGATTMDQVIEELTLLLLYLTSWEEKFLAI